MALEAGTRLGVYEIVSAIGAGGMGEVYRARDTRLDRTVAIKVLPPHWADDPDMRQRFDREAQTLASLSHPHICVLHDIGRHDAMAFLVMEYLEGETLATRLERGALGVSEALKLGIQIADALDKAHRRGVVHRDLKPANVMLTATGAKLLDFGLAKSGGVVSGPSGVLSGLSALPTRTDLTSPGTMLGTLQYMAPEQLEGSDADARTDIFAFGVLLHEMVTGKRAFEGKSHVLLISAIATAHTEPLSKVQPAAPKALDHVVKTCLAKDPVDRWQTARDLLAELEWIAEGGANTSGVPAVPVAPRRRRLDQWVFAGAAIAAAAAAVPAILYFQDPGDAPELRFRVPIQLTADVAVAGGRGGGRGAAQGFQGVSGPAVFDPADFAVSPDGRAIAFVARGTNTEPRMLFVRPVDSVTPQRLPGTEDAVQPFWSSDSRWIGFVAGTTLKRVEASGGPPEDICEVTSFSGGTWNDEGTILFGSTQGLLRVAAEGGTPEAVTTLEPSETGHFWPHFLPDGRQYLFTAWTAQASTRAIVAGSLDSKETSRVVSVGSNAAYVDPGFLVFQRESAVYAQAFDLGRLAVSGEPVRVADDVTYDASRGLGDFRASRSGVLAYFYSEDSTIGISGPTADLGEWQMTWISRTGQVIERVGPPAAYRGIEISPDTTRIAVHRHDANGGDVYVIERRGSQTNLTRNAANHSSMPIWSADGSRIVYSSLREGKWGLYQTLSNGAGAEELLYESDLPKAPMSWSPDGKHLVFWVDDPKTGSDLWVLTTEDKKAAPLIATSARETHAQISPDGRWIAYTDNSKDGRNEVWVKPFPVGAGGWQISFNGGDWPRWRGDSKELFYHSAVTVTGTGISANATNPYPYGGPIYSVEVNTSSGIFEPSASREVTIFAALNVPHTGGDYHPYAVTRDGQRFLILQWVVPTEQSTSPIGPDTYSGLTVALNWTQALRK